MDFMEEVKNFGLSTWILLASVLVVMLLLIILVIVNIKIMRKYRLDLTRSRLARVSAQIEVIDGWCAIVVENTGQVVANNVKIKAKGPIMRYYYDYISTCRLDNVFKRVLGRKFTLVPGGRRKIKLFPLKPVTDCKSITAERLHTYTPEADVNLVNRSSHNDSIEIDQVFSVEDAKILKSTNKQEKKVADQQEKQNAKMQAKYDKIDLKRQKAIQKHNKKAGKGTHTSLVVAPDMSKIAKNAKIKIYVSYLSLGYRFKKKKYVYKHVNLYDFAQEANVVENVLTAQKDLLKEVVYLQEQIYKAVNVQDRHID